MTSQQRSRVTAGLLVIFGAACNDGPIVPQLGTMRVSVRSSGGDFDIDGYDLVVDSQVRWSLPPNAPVVGRDGTARADFLVSDVSIGTHDVVLERVADNCTVTGARSRSVVVTGGQPVDVVFVLVCVATGVEITTRTTGPDEPTRYEVLVDDRSSVVAANGAVAVTRLAAGMHTVALRVRGENCSVAGGRQLTVAVTARTITPVVFEISCTPAVRREKIAYVVDDTTIDGKRGPWMVLINPDGSGAVPLALGDAPAWSPDGSRLVFSTTLCTSDFYYDYLTCTGGLSVMDPETWNVTALSYGDGGLAPAWAPTGDLILFTRCCDAYPKPQLHMVRADNTLPVDLIIPDLYGAHDPAWSPDGQQIALACFVKRALSQDLCMVSPDGSAPFRLVSDSTTESSPAWSPDGTMIAFTRYSPESKRTQIFLVVPDGSGLTRLTDGFDPSWSRDGSRLVFAGGDGLYTINVDGSQRIRLTTGAHRSPAWRP